MRIKKKSSKKRSKKKKNKGFSKKKLERLVISIFKENPSKLLNYKQISKLLRILIVPFESVNNLFCVKSIRQVVSAVFARTIVAMNKHTASKRPVPEIMLLLNAYFIT